MPFLWALELSLWLVWFLDLAMVPAECVIGTVNLRVSKTVSANSSRRGYRSSKRFRRTSSLRSGWCPHECTSKRLASQLIPFLCFRLLFRQNISHVELMRAFPANAALADILWAGPHVTIAQQPPIVCKMRSTSEKRPVWPMSTVDSANRRKRAQTIVKTS